MAALADTNPVTVSSRTVTLTLTAAVAVSDTVTVDYTAPTGDAAKPIRDTLGNAAANLSAQAVTNETAKPTATFTSSATLHPTREAFTVTITFSGSVTGLDAGEVTVTNGTATEFSGSATTYTVLVTPTPGVDGEVTVAVAADAGTSGNGVGNASASKTFAVDTKAPAFQTAVVIGNTLTLTYDEDLDGTSTPAGSAYAVKAGPSGSLVDSDLAANNAVTVSGKTVTLKLDNPVGVGDTVTVAYTAPTGANAKLQDTLGNAAGNLTARTVAKRDQVLTGFRYSASSVTLGAAAPTVTAHHRGADDPELLGRAPGGVHGERLLRGVDDRGGGRVRHHRHGGGQRRLQRGHRDVHHDGAERRNSNAGRMDGAGKVRNQPPLSGGWDGGRCLV